jgi:hypothetical protein
METYTLINVLMFLKNQQQSEYFGIEAIFEIIEDKLIPEEEKMGIVIMILRKLGLEEEFTYEPFDLASEEDEPAEKIRRFMPYRVDQFRIPIMDSIISYDCVLN